MKITVLRQSVLILFFSIISCFLFSAARAQTYTPSPEKAVKKKSYNIFYVKQKAGSSPWTLSMFRTCHQALNQQSSSSFKYCLDVVSQEDLISEKRRSGLNALFNARYENDKIDFVICGRDVADLFDHRKFFPNASAFYPCVDVEQLGNEQKKSDKVIYSPIRLSPLKTAMAVKACLPKTKKIIFVSGLGRFDTLLEHRAKQELENKWKGIDIEYWVGRPPGKIINDLAGLVRGTVLIFLSYAFDSENNLYISAAVLKELCSVSKVPVFGISDTCLGRGIVGGYLQSSKKAGQKAAAMILAHIEGKKFEKTAPKKDYGRYIFDWQELKKWKIDEKNLPGGSVIKNIPSGIFERYPALREILLIFLVAAIFIILSLVRFIVYRRKAEENLRRSHQKLQSIIENIGIGVALVTPDMKLVEVNSQMKIWFPEIDLNDESKLCFHHIGEKDQKYPCDYCPVKKTFETGLVSDCTAVRVIGGSNRTLRILSTPFFDQRGHILGAIELLEDISEKLKFEKQIRQAQKMESLGALAGGIAHDFNNILASIIGYSELALEEMPPGADIESYVQEVLTASDRAQSLVKRILTFARVEDEEIKPVKLEEILKECLQLIRSSIPSYIEIKSSIKSSLKVMGDPTKINQIFMNLLTNAAHAMDEDGGIININLNDVIIDSKKSIEMKLDEGRYIELLVSDNGQGIPPEILDSIFEPYFTTKKSGEGTGMGLAMVHGIVENYNGRIFVESTIGKGTAFTVYLPVTHEHDFETVKNKKQNITDCRGSERVLYVDDEKGITDLAKLFLSSLGYDVTVINDSQRALELFKAAPENFDLVISDLAMPGLKGDFLIAEIIEIRPDIPVILCSGYAKNFKENQLPKGVKAFLQKPVTKNQLAQAVRSVLHE